MPTPNKDTEITLGTGRMLVLFFALVIVCAVFFGIGFSLGKKTSLLGIGGAPKRSTETPAAAVQPGTGKDESKPATDFSFYKSVGAAGANTELAPAEPQTKAAGKAAGGPPVAAETKPASNATPATGGYFVQVAAVTRMEDAEALVEALKKKQYPAFAANNASVDKYYHIQVGPYANVKDAEAMRARLMADGYNPILKK